MDASIVMTRKELDALKYLLNEGRLTYWDFSCHEYVQWEAVPILEDYVRKCDEQMSKGR